MLAPLEHPDLVRQLAGQGVTALSLDLVPRTLSRAQPMDALTSQANVAGYKAVLVAAGAYGGYFPLLMTAAGTVRPAAVLVLGTGVAGLQAIGTARRLGAVVTAYDIRPETKAEVESLGARFLDLSVVGSGSGSGGYARELSEAEHASQQHQLVSGLARFDVVITTARVPGRRPPVLVTTQALDGMRPGSVAVDLAAGDTGGNVEGSVPDTTLVLGNGVTVIGAGNLPSSMATAASNAYARNVAALVTELVRDGVPNIDPADELQAAVLVTQAGSIVNPAVAATVGDTTLAGGVR
jgi:NAD(P) transhydrogenase subunit alpha